MKKEDGFEKFVAIFILVLIFIATCITLAFKFSQYGYLLEIKDYFNFAASFGGAILSAVISLMILYITVYQTREIQKENMKQVKIANINEKISDYKQLYSLINIGNDAISEILTKYHRRLWRQDDVLRIRECLEGTKKCIYEMEDNPLLKKVYAENNKLSNKYSEINNKIGRSILIDDTKEILKLIEELNKDMKIIRNGVLQYINKLIKNKYEEIDVDL
ncbi:MULTISPECIES: hypothetical protein [unclassified Clostridium]|uniref:hypothetical protein n=1 Tax=unclassified Clostridium TaxID=2614128 RepID=UPI00207A2DB1|nr:MULTISPECIES: hypothetical protein [unclassified Clostridium]